MARGVNNETIIFEYCSGDSIRIISDRHGISRSTVRRVVFLAGVVRSRADGVRLAASKGFIGSGMRGKKRTFSDSHRRAIKESAMARGKANAKGISLKPNGYIEITRGDMKGKMEHRVIMERILGRILRTDEIVHHKDKNRANNEAANLAVMSRSDHTKMHMNEGKEL